jgi:hypothetical protein
MGFFDKPATFKDVFGPTKPKKEKRRVFVIHNKSMGAYWAGNGEYRRIQCWLPQ